MTDQTIHTDGHCTACRKHPADCRCFAPCVACGAPGERGAHCPRLGCILCGPPDGWPRIELRAMPWRKSRDGQNAYVARTTIGAGRYGAPRAVWALTPWAARMREAVRVGIAPDRVCFVDDESYTAEKPGRKRATVDVAAYSGKA